MLLTILMYFGCLALWLLRCTLLGMAVYCDAKSKHVLGATRWGVIAGVFGVAGGLVYLLGGKKHLLPARHCPVCGTPLAPEQQACPQCLAVAGRNPGGPQSHGLAHRAKTLLISWLIATAMIALVSLFFLIGLFSARGNKEDFTVKEYTVVQDGQTEFSIEESAPWFDELP